MTNLFKKNLRDRLLLILNLNAEHYIAVFVVICAHAALAKIAVCKILAIVKVTICKLSFTVILYAKVLRNEFDSQGIRVAQNLGASRKKLAIAGSFIEAPASLGWTRTLCRSKG